MRVTGEDADPRTQRIHGFERIHDGDPIIVEDIRAPPSGISLPAHFQYPPRQIEMHDMMRKINQSRSRLHCVIGPDAIGKSDLAKAVSFSCESQRWLLSVWCSFRLSSFFFFFAIKNVMCRLH